MNAGINPWLCSSPVLACILVGVMIGKGAAVQAEEMLPSEIPAEAETSAVLDVYVEETTLGETKRPRRVGQVKVYTPQIFKLKPTLLRDPVQDIPFTITTSNYYLLRLPIDIGDVGDNRSYKKAWVTYAVETPEVRAIALYPLTVIDRQDVEEKRSFAITPSLSVKPLASVKAGAEVIDTYTYEVLRPRITAFGQGSPTFSWEFVGEEGQPVLTGSRWLFAVIEVPDQTEILKGEVTYDADVEWSFRDLTQLWSAEAPPAPFSWELPVEAPPIPVRQLKG